MRPGTAVSTWAWPRAANVHSIANSMRRATEDVDEVDDEDSSDFADRAFLIVRRVVADKRPIQGKTTTVTVELYNAGST